jgi:hypothetical protein
VMLDGRVEHLRIPRLWELSWDPSVVPRILP